jgi:hypothetical protein
MNVSGNALYGTFVFQKFKDGKMDQDERKGFRVLSNRN